MQSCGVQAAVPVAADEHNAWSAAKSALLRPQTLDVVELWSGTTNGVFVVERQPLSNDAVQAVRELTTEHGSAWFEEQDGQRPIVSVLLAFRSDDEGKSLAAVQSLASKLGVVCETSKTYSHEFLMSCMASRIDAARVPRGLRDEWWSPLSDATMLGAVSDALLATPSTSRASDFFPLTLYTWFVQSYVENGGPPTLSGAAWVEVDRSQLSKDLGVRGAGDKLRVLGSPIAQLHALGAALGDRCGNSQAIDDVVPNMVTDVCSSLCGWNLMGQLRVGVRMCEFCPLTDKLLFMKTAAVPSLDEDRIGVGLPYTPPRTLEEMQAFIDQCGDVGASVVPLPFATHIASHVPVQRYLHALAGLRQDERDKLERKIREVAERKRQHDEWRLEAAAAGAFLSHSTFEIYSHRRDVYLSIL